MLTAIPQLSPPAGAQLTPAESGGLQIESSVCPLFTLSFEITVDQHAPQDQAGAQSCFAQGRQWAKRDPPPHPACSGHSWLAFSHGGLLRSKLPRTPPTRSQDVLCPLLQPRRRLRLVSPPQKPRHRPAPRLHRPRRLPPRKGEPSCRVASQPLLAFFCAAQATSAGERKKAGFLALAALSAYCGEYLHRRAFHGHPAPWFWDGLREAARDRRRADGAECGMARRRRPRTAQPGDGSSGRPSQNQYHPRGDLWVPVVFPHGASRAEAHFHWARGAVVWAPPPGYGVDASKAATLTRCLGRQVWIMAGIYVAEFLIHALRSPDLDVINGLKCPTLPRRSRPLPSLALSFLCTHP